MIQPIFESIIAFDYYDGPEAGLATTMTGDTFRFAAIGETDPWALRAFTFDTIQGDWQGAFQMVRSQVGAARGQVILGPDASEFLGSLRAKVDAATAIKHYIAIGRPDFTDMKIREVNPDELKTLKAAESYSAAFQAAETLLRQSR